MIEWLKKTFQNSPNIDEIKEENDKDHRIDKDEKDVVTIECVGHFKFEIEENDESKDDFLNRIKEKTVYSWNNHALYASHFTFINYDINATYNNEVFRFEGRMKYYNCQSEIEAYEIFKKLRSGQLIDEVQSKLKRRISNKLKSELRDRGIEQVKKDFDNDNTFKIEFTIKTEDNPYAKDEMII